MPMTEEERRMYHEKKRREGEKIDKLKKKNTSIDIDDVLFAIDNDIEPFNDISLLPTSSRIISDDEEPSIISDEDNVKTIGDLHDDNEKKLVVKEEINKLISLLFKDDKLLIKIFDKSKKQGLTPARAMHGALRMMFA